METTTVTTTGTAYDHQQQVVKNKRKKFNPKYMLSNSSSDDEVGNGLNKMNQQRREDVVEEEEEEDVERSGSEEDEEQVNNRNNSLIVSPKLNDIIDKNSIYQIPNTNFSISKSQNNNNDSPPPPPTVSSPVETSPLVPSNPFLSPSKLSLLQTFGNLQQQQQLLQQAAVAAAIAPQYNQQNSAMSLTETEAKFREFAFKTMQELLNIYGLSLSPNDIVDAMKQQHLGQTAAATISGQASLEPPTPPRTPVAQTAQGQGQHITPKHYNNNNDDAKENYEENSMRQSSSMSPIKVPHSVKSKLVKSENESDLEEYPRRSSQYDDSNYSDDERLGGRHSVISGSGHMNGGGGDEESDHGSDLYTDASSFDSSKLSLKNVENLLDKSSPMSFYNPMMHLATIQSDQAEKQLIAEYSKYLTKYQSYLDCHNEQCQMENQREHYHCYDIMCQNKILNKKEEIIRHLKWHKKRSESLNHGFLRFTSSDDCTIQFGYCQHNRKQTHYHCIQNKCDKTYISTSDVQMHSNYHRKDSAIYQEGFQRYRATEKCMVQHCIFYGQCTTHFHCRRCKYTFKNKADMEKHKTYHMKDEQLLKDGFKKFLKTEPCKVDGCRFTMICNHIHCVRSNCTYVLHSSGQLLSHKRKHERMDAEMAYRRFKMGQSAKDLSPAELSALQQFHGLDLSSKPATPTPSTVNGQFPIADQATNEKINKLLNNATMENLNMLLSHETNPADLSPELLQQIQLHQEQQMMKQANGRESPDDRIEDHKNGTDNGDSLEDGIPKSVIQNHPAQSAGNDEMKAPTIEEVEQIISQYFTDQCTKQHSNEQNEPLNLNLKTNSNKSNLIECFMSNNESHLHCLITGCEAVVPRGLKDISEHLRMHELNRGADSIIQNSNLLQITSIEGFFNRKRGRPPKNRVVEVYNNTHQPPQAIFTSFKLERNDQNGKNSSSQSSRVATPQNRTPKQRPEKPEPSNGTKIQIIQSGERCCDSSCVYQKLLHYHCNFSKFCHFSTNQLTVMDHHLNDFHTTIEIQENYDYFDRNFDCKMRSCCYNKITSHFHCLLCKFIFTSPAEMSEHVCEENIEDNYENFDIIESDLMKARPQPSIAHHQHQQRFMEAEFFRREEKPMVLDKFDEKFYSHESKVALNSDVDLIKTTKVPYVKPELMLEDDKVSVVRSAGTWVPHNSDIENKSASTSPANLMMNSSFPGMGHRDDSNCDRPFCKLKRKKHEHCDLCNQAFTDSMKLKIHFLKHQHTKLGGGFDSDKQDDMSPVKKEDHSEPHDLSKPTANLQSLMFPIPSQAAGTSSSAMMDSLSLQNMQLANLAQFYQQNSMYYQSLYPFLGNQGLPGLGLDQQMPMMQFPFPAAAAALAGGGFDFGLPAPQLPGNKSSMAAHKRKLEQLEELQGNKKIQKTSERPKEYQKKSYKDDSVPTGYLKFRFNQDCNFPNCGYRNHQSHFHCCRKDCFYSFCDKTRFVQHTARHERLDKLMGDDFKQFRANMHCGYGNCAYNKNLGPHNKSSHFHCLKCNYICSDTNKVVAHRRQHSKQEYIRMAGFRKISNNEHCNMPDANTPDGECPYTLKQTHYHCLVCKMSVLSRNQLPSHNHRIRPGNGMGDEGEMMNDNGILILGDNGSDDGSST